MFRSRVGEWRLERLESREVPYASAAVYAGSLPKNLPDGINLSADGAAYDPGNHRQGVTVTVGLNNPTGGYKRGFDIKLTWVMGNGQTVPGGRQHFQKDESPGWGKSNTLNARFADGQYTPAPAGAVRLLAEVDPGNAIHETSELDNRISLDLRTRVTTPDNPPAARPRTFVFLLGGWLSEYSEPSGMNGLDAAIRADGRLGSNVYTYNGRGTGTAIVNDARIDIDRQLRFSGYTPSDRVILVGHSLGGDAARQLAADVSSSYSGSQAAVALVTIDPISFHRVQETRGTDQSRETQQAPAGVNTSRILNLVQTGSGPKGYHIAGLDSRHDVVVSGPGIKHTSIDDDPAVRRRVIDFLAAI